MKLNELYLYGGLFVTLHLWTCGLAYCYKAGVGPTWPKSMARHYGLARLDYE
jgi:hypothetical protein